MSSYPPPSPSPHFEQALAPFLGDEGLPFAEVLPAAAAVAQAFADEGVRLGRARVGNRPDCCEPRAVKRRPKEYDRLNKPLPRQRNQAQRFPFPCF